VTADAAALAAVTGILGVVIGAVLSAALGDWTARRREAREESRATRADEATRQLEALQQTRRRAHDVVTQLKGLAIKPAAPKMRSEYESANDALIGDGDVIRDYRELLVDLQTRFGRGLPIQASLRAVQVLAEIDDSIAKQEQRVRRGEAPLVIGQDLAEELFDMDAFSRRLLTVNRPPALQGLLARGYLDLLRLATAVGASAAPRHGKWIGRKALDHLSGRRSPVS
jgi:type II secretory pathway pseudopilin PulG